MQPKPESFNIIITGAWNPAIFNAKWVSENLCKSNNCNVSFALALENLDLPPRIQFENFELYPEKSRIRIGSLNPDVDGLSNASQVAKKILDLLSHTPVDGLGINFGFTAEYDDFSHDMFSPADQSSLEECFDVRQTQIIRAIRLPEEAILNYKLTYSPSSYEFDFNFHHDRQDRFSSVLSEETVFIYYEKIKKILKEAYDYEWEN